MSLLNSLPNVSSSEMIEYLTGQVTILSDGYKDGVYFLIGFNPYAKKNVFANPVTGEVKQLSNVQIQANPGLEIYLCARLDSQAIILFLLHENDKSNEGAKTFFKKHIAPSDSTGKITFEQYLGHAADTFRKMIEAAISKGK